MKKRARHEWKPGELYQSCGGHPVICTEADEGDDYGGLFGISLVDGSFGHGCSKVACAPRLLTLKQALRLRKRILTLRARYLLKRARGAV